MNALQNILFAYICFQDFPPKVAVLFSYKVEDLLGNFTKLFTLNRDEFKILKPSCPLNYSFFLS